jgi:hypothetical protein
MMTCRQHPPILSCSRTCHPLLWTPYDDLQAASTYIDPNLLNAHGEVAEAVYDTAVGGGEQVYDTAQTEAVYVIAAGLH